MYPVKNKISTAVLSAVTLMSMSGVAQAQISINSNVPYATQSTESKFADISKAQSKDEERWAITKDLLNRLANGTAATDQNFKDNLRYLNTLNNGDTFTLYGSAGNQVGATVSSESQLRLGAGSVTNGRANVSGMSLLGKNYTFAGGTTAGEASLGNVANGEFRTLTGVASGRITASSSDAVNGSQLFAVADALTGLDGRVTTNTTNITNLQTTVDKGLNFQDGAGNKFNRKMGDTTTIKNGDTNVTVGADAATGTFSVGLAKNLTADSVTTGDVSISKTGVDAGNKKVINVANGDVSATSKDAINGSQLHQTNQNVAQNTTNITNLQATVDKGLNFQDGNGNKFNRKLGETTTIKNGDSNVTVTADAATGAFNVGLAKNLTADSVTTGNVSISTTGVNAGNKKVTNVANGDVSATSTDAVNGSQLFEIKQRIDTLNVPDNIVTYDDNSRTNITLKGTGGTKITNLKAGDVSATSTDAINGSQLHQTNQNVAQNTTNITNLTNEVNKGLNFQDGNGNKFNRKLGETTTIKNGDSNVTVTADAATGSFNVGLAKNLTADSLTTGNVSISTTGVNAGDKKVTNVANGDVSATSKDAVNGSQLFTTNQNVTNNTTNINRVDNFVKQGFNVTGDTGGSKNIQMGSTMRISAADTNIVTKTTTNGVSVGLNRNLNVDSVTTGNVSISHTGVNAGGNKVTNVADGDISATSTDAVNGSQLYKAINNMNPGYFNQIDYKPQIEANRKLASQGIAAAMAMNIEYPEQRPGQVATGIGVGTYDGEQAMAVGVNFLTDNGKWKINATYGQAFGKKSKAAGKVSVGWVW